MPEVVCTFSSAKARQERANGSSETGNRSFGGSAQECFEFAEGHFDGIEIGRVLRQVTKCRVRVLDCLAYAGTFVNADIVHHDDIAARERRNQALLDVSQERLCVHGSLDHHRGDHFIVPQGGHEGDRLPLSTRGTPDQFDASRTAPPKPYHLGGDRSLVNEYQAGRIKHALLSNPAPARPGHVGAMLLCRSQTLFF